MFRSLSLYLSCAFCLALNQLNLLELNFLIEPYIGCDQLVECKRFHFDLQDANVFIGFVYDQETLTMNHFKRKLS